MSTTAIIILIIILLVLAVGASVYLQYKEQVKAQKRQKIAKFQYRARYGQELYDRFSDLPVSGHTRTVILQYIVENLRKVLLVEPNDMNAKRNLDESSQKLANPELPADKQALQTPSDPQEMVVLMGRVKNLMRFIHKIGRLPGIDINSARQSLAKLKELYQNLQTHTYIAVAKKRLSEKSYAQALHYLDSAKRLLLLKNIADPKTQAMLEKLDALTQEVQTQQQAPEEDDEVETNEQEQESSDLGDSDDLFQPKKKW